MKATLATVAIAITVIVVLVLAACASRKEAQREIVALIDAMKKGTTADEWKIISKYQLKRLNPRQTGYRQTSGGV